MTQWNSRFIGELRQAGELIIEIADGFDEMEERAFRAGYEFGALEGYNRFPSDCFRTWRASLAEQQKTDA